MGKTKIREEDMKETAVKQERIYEGNVIHVRKDEARMPDGKIAPREVVEHPGGVGIALESPDGKFYFVKQWRYAQEMVMLEYPAGKKEKGEDPFTTAKREIVEETGYEGKDFVYLGKVVPTPAYDNEVIDLYYARQGEYKGVHLDEDEYLNLYQYTLDEMTDMIFDGTVTDAKTVAMTFLLKEYKRRNG